MEGTERGQTGSEEQLRAVGQESLRHARESVEQRSALALVHAVAVGDVAGDAAHAQNRYGIVGRHAVGEYHQGRDGGFGAALAANVAREARNEEVDAAVVANHFHQSPGQEGNEDGFVHARHAFGHRREPSGHIKGAGGQTDGAREDIAQ